VYSCTDVWKNQLVAKVLKPYNAPPEAHLERVRKEFEALVHVRHPNIVHVFDAFVLRGTCYIVTERCDQTLADLLRIDQFDPETWFLPVARCLLQAVHFVHVQNMVHCDIHLRNVFVRFVPDEVLPDQLSASTFKLGDFGLARAVGSVTADGTFLNAIRPPEAVQPHEFGPLDHRIDIFQVGLLLLQVLHGQAIDFDETEMLEGRPRQLAEQMDTAWGAGLSRMLRRHASQRTPTALQAWLDLQTS
jgi:serine/threonine-protein kinase